MNIVVSLRPDVAARLDATTRDQDRLVSLRRRLADLGLVLTEMHPGETSPDLRRWYTLEAPDRDLANRAFAVLRGSSLVDAVFEKPADQLP